MEGRARFRYDRFLLRLYFPPNQTMCMLSPHCRRRGRADTARARRSTALNQPLARRQGDNAGLFAFCNRTAVYGAYDRRLLGMSLTGFTTTAFAPDARTGAKTVDVPLVASARAAPRTDAYATASTSP